MRGKPAAVWAHTALRRITPADAGKTCGDGDRLDSGQDHPRRCGENVVAFSTTPLMVGSPPQMRGKLTDAANRDINSRITPADAGKTCLLSSRSADS
mgnify:CR=1 FL=1